MQWRTRTTAVATTAALSTGGYIQVSPTDPAVVDTSQPAAPPGPNDRKDSNNQNNGRCHGTHTAATSREVRSRGPAPTEHTLQRHGARCD